MPRKVTKPKAVTKSTPAAKTAPATVVVNDTGKGLKVAVVATNPDDLKETFEKFGGSRSHDWNDVIACQTANALWLKCPETREKQIKAALAGLNGIEPKDELEGMMAAQLIAAHNAAMECYRRAMIDQQNPEARRENLAHAGKLSRTFVTLLEALNRHRGKGQQKMTVEHVHVHSGGQAVVGMVGTSGAGDHAKIEGQPHAKQIAHAPQPAMRRADEEREPVPIAGDAEWPLPHARRTIDGGAEG
jgi:hypothetical protein